MVYNVQLSISHLTACYKVAKHKIFHRLVISMDSLKIIQMNTSFLNQAMLLLSEYKYEKTGGRENRSQWEVTLDKMIESIDQLEIASSVPEDVGEYGIAKLKNSFES